jgi:ubiquinone/menaquinone biosynthesis C-methylase UbiE
MTASISGGKTVSGSARSIDTTAATAYEEHLVTKVFAPWAERVVDLAAPIPGEAVLDVACGTGIGARLAGPRVMPGGRVVGLDNDPSMVEVARRLAAERKIDVEWHCETALALSFPDASFDLCLCLQGPQFLSDPLAGLTNIHRVLKATGRLAASFWASIKHNKGHHALARALENQDLAPALRPFSLGDPEKARALFAEAGFRTVALCTEERVVHFPSVVAFIDGVAAGAPATRHALAKLDDNRKQDFVADVENILEPYAGLDGVRLPTRSHIVIAEP